MGASTEMSRLDSIPTEHLNALLGLDIGSLDALAEAAEALIALANKKDELLALLDGGEPEPEVN